jgi:hypothetical protein
MMQVSWLAKHLLPINQEPEAVLANIPPEKPANEPAKVNDGKPLIFIRTSKKLHNGNQLKLRTK